MQIGPLFDSQKLVNRQLEINKSNRKSSLRSRRPQYSSENRIKESIFNRFKSPKSKGVISFNKNAPVAVHQEPMIESN